MESEQLSDSSEADVGCPAAVRGWAGAAEHAATPAAVKAMARNIRRVRTLTA
jgi:hypothetical protein